MRGCLRCKKRPPSSDSEDWGRKKTLSPLMGRSSPWEEKTQKSRNLETREDRDGIKCSVWKLVFQMSLSGQGARVGWLPVLPSSPTQMPHNWEKLYLSGR